MENLRLLFLFINAISLALALAFLIIILWFYSKKPLLQTFSVFLLSVVFWHSAVLLSELIQIIDPSSQISFLLALIGDVGFASASVSLYVFVSSLIVAHTRILRIIAFSSLSLIILNNLIILQSVFADIQLQSLSNAPVVGVSILYFLMFDVISVYLILRYRKKIRSGGTTIGLILFVLGQGLVFLNPELGVVSFALLLSAIATLVISFSMVQREMIAPLEERVSQVEAIQRISVSIMQRNQLDAVVNEVTKAVVNWLGAADAIVFLVEGGLLRIASTYHLPHEIIFTSDNTAVAKQTVNQEKSLLVENYNRDWLEGEDFYLARDTVGSMMSVPLFVESSILGVLQVVTGRGGKVFDENDLRLLEQLSNQVSVAISHSQLYENLREALNQLQVVLTSTENPVIAVDRNLKIIFINPNASRLLSNILGNDSVSIISGIKPIPKSLLPDDLRSFLYQIRENGFYAYEYEFNNSIYIGRIATIGAERKQGWVTVLNDVTNLIELDRMKNEMVRMTSHDLKNPLQAALANLDLLREDIDINNDEAILSLNLIEKQLDKMSRIIGGILDLERIKLGKQAYSDDVNLLMLLNQAVEEIEDFAEDNKIKITKNYSSLNDQKIIGDFNQLKRVFVNLIENAIKFTPEDGTVQIVGMRESYKVTISIRDNGIGIPNELKERIFERFFRGEQNNYQHVSGSGLGLSFVKSIVEKHRGVILVDSEPNQGSCFTVVFDDVI